MLENINSILWAIVTIFIFIFGLFFSFKLRFPQFKFFKIFHSLKSNNAYGISPINTLFLTLAGRIGVGSIAGVALAIYLGGAGTIFWMWIIALISASLAYVETMMAIKYKVVNGDECFGGPSYYIKNGYKSKNLAYLYSLIVVIAYLIGFIPIQSNTITKSFNMVGFSNHIFIGIIISIISLIIIWGGIKKISLVTSKLVPIMTIIYVILGMLSIIFNLNEFPKIIKEIFVSAFSLKPFFSGFLVVLLIGVQRGIFSNESGIGLGAIAASASNSTNGCKSGYIQVLGIYITTMIICTSTGFMVLSSPFNVIIDDPNGIELTNLAFNFHFGVFGSILLIMCILLFSFSTILTGYYYCESSLGFLCNFSKPFLKILTFFSVFFGSILSPMLIWKIIDILVAFLAIINIYVLYCLNDEVLKYHKKYDNI